MSLNKHTGEVGGRGGAKADYQMRRSLGVNVFDLIPVTWTLFASFLVEVCPLFALRVNEMMVKGHHLRMRKFTEKIKLLKKETIE